MTAEGVSKAAAPEPCLAILAFHKIGEPPPGEYPTWNYVPAGTFCHQLELLRDNGWQVIDLATLLRGLAQANSLPTRSVLLTFDDGYRSMLTITLPLLSRFDCPAVLFVPTAFVGGSNCFDEGIEPKEEICDWRELEDLERHGVAIQSHAVSHRRFSELTRNQQRDELVRSKAELEQRLARSVEVIAYPYGDEGAEPEALPQMLEEAGYRGACLYGGGVNPLPIADRYRLARVAMGSDTDLERLLAR